jgi:endoglucanase
MKPYYQENNKEFNMSKKLFIILLILLGCSFAKNEKINFWNKQRGGANIFNKEVKREDIIAAKKLKISFLRLMVDKFESQEKDFLIGSSDKYIEINTQDLTRLKDILRICAEEDMPVIISTATLPGSRWLQNNNFEDDLRIWISNEYQIQAAEFWQDLAKELKDYPIVIGYNILNEPHLEQLYEPYSTHIEYVNQEIIQKNLFEFYKKIIVAIRYFDEETPIIIESSAYADPKALEYLIPQGDKKIIYSFHMYEPYEYTNKEINRDRFSYPGIIADKYWNKESLEAYMQSVINFQKRHNIPSNRILVGEFGAHRKSDGIENYFSDLIDIFNENKWHYAFYSFREDTWEGMDYELGNRYIENLYSSSGELNNSILINTRSVETNIFKVIKKNLELIS